MASFENENRVRVYQCKTWEQFVNKVRNPQFRPDSDDKVLHLGRGAIFRGHSDPGWKLWSTIERDLFPEASKGEGSIENPNFRMLNGLDWYDGVCSHILRKFKKSARGMPEINVEIADVEMWAVGRHFGLLSPYLDWTGSPYVAAFFAFEEIYRKCKWAKSIPSKFPGKVVHVWGLRLWDELTNNDELEVIEAETWHSTRQRAQISWFTKLRSKDHIELEKYLISRSLGCYLERYDLCADMAVTAIRDLELMGINYLSLFPDLTGAALNASIDTEALRFIEASKIDGSKT